MKTFQEELVRKIFHFLALLPVCFFSYFVPNKYFSLILPIVLVFFVFDFFNLYFFLENKKSKIVKFFFSLLRDDERKKYVLNGSTWILISIFVCFILDFKKVVQVSGFLVLAISDSLAALFGKKYGTRKFLNKTIEGTFAFFVSCFIITFTIASCEVGNFNSVEVLLKSIFISFFIAIFELFANKIKLNDNFLIPVSFCVLDKLWSVFIHAKFFGKGKLLFSFV